MAKRLTYMQRAERWYAKQVKNKTLRDADYSMLTRKLPICYEPAVMMSRRNEQTKHDILSLAKELNTITKFKLS
jgi:hypothetical protein